MINESSMNIFDDSKTYNGIKGVADIKDIKGTTYTSEPVSFQSTLFPSCVEVWLSGIDFKLIGGEVQNPPQIKVSLLGYAPWIAPSEGVTDGEKGWATCGTATVFVSELVGKARATSVDKLYGGDAISLPFRTIAGVKQYKVSVALTDTDSTVESGHIYGNLQFNI